MYSFEILHHLINCFLQKFWSVTDLYEFLGECSVEVCISLKKKKTPQTKNQPKTQPPKNSDVAIRFLTEIRETFQDYSFGYI